MSCALTSGYTIDCRDSVGGMKAAYFIEFNNVTAVTDTAGVVTAIERLAGKRFYKYELPRETGNFKDTMNANEANGSIFYTHELKMILNKMQSSLRNEIKLLAMNRLMIVAEDKNGKYWLLGREGGMYLSAGTSDAGTAMGDRNGYDLTFTGNEKEPLIEVDAATAATLTA